jgi:hypothetical protein
MRKFTYSFVAAALLLASCGEQRLGGKSHGAIVLGDSSTIVTETDPQFLKDYFNDITVTPVPDPVPTDTSTPAVNDVPKDTVATPAQATPQPVAAAPATMNGLKFSFDQCVIAVSNVDVRTQPKNDYGRNSGASVSAKDLASFNGAKVQVSGKVSDIKVEQRYSSKLTIQTGLGKLYLQDLGSYVSDWKGLQGSGNTFNSAALGNPGFKNVTAAAIKNAAQKQLRRDRNSRTVVNKWNNELKDVRSANQSPCKIIFTQVQYRISGKDEKGKSFQKLLQFDLPY